MISFLCKRSLSMKLVLGLNGSVLALRGFPNLSKEDIQKYEQISFDHIRENHRSFPEVDYFNSAMLDVEVPSRSVNFSNLQYSSNLNKELPCNLDTPNIKHINHSQLIQDDEVPNIIKNLGLSLRKENVYTHMEWNEKEQDVILRDENGEETSFSNLGIANDSEIVLYDEILCLSNKDYKTINSIISAINNKATSETSASILKKLPIGDILLYAKYTKYKNNCLSRKKVIFHELKHIKSQLLVENRELKPNSKRLSVEDIYRINVEDERSAYLEETMSSISQYLQKGKYEDFSMFTKEDSWLVKTLKQQSPQNIEEKLCDYNYIVNETLKNWDNDYASKYHAPMIEHCTYQARSCPLSKEEDKNRSEFFLQRSIMYSTQVFNPKTKKHEIKDLSKFIKNDIEIDNKVVEDIINPCKKIIKNRKKDRNDSKDIGEVDEAIIVEARDMSRKYFTKCAIRQKAYNTLENDLPEDVVSRLNNLKDKVTSKPQEIDNYDSRTVNKAKLTNGFSRGCIQY